VRYYQSQFSSLRRKNLLMELVLAISTSSVVAGLWLWETAVGGIIWKAVATLAAFLAVIKPLVKLSDQVQQKSDVLTNWRLLEDGLQQLTLSISQYRKYDDEMRNSFFTLMKTKTTIIQKEPSESIDERLRRRCFEQVNQELPLDSFFIPKE
jgi:hypothetical protein